MEAYELDDALANQRLLIESLLLRVAMLEKIVLSEVSPGQEEIIGEGSEYFDSNIIHLTKA